MMKPYDIYSKTLSQGLSTEQRPSLKTENCFIEGSIWSKNYAVAKVWNSSFQSFKGKGLKNFESRLFGP